MLCPFCSHQISPIWNVLFTTHDEKGQLLQAPTIELKSYLGYDLHLRRHDSVTVKLDWAQCANESCHQILVKVTRKLEFASVSKNDEVRNWFAVPKRKPPLPVDELVRDPFAKDFREACLILDDSPRMSSVLSRRILADLLEQYAKLTDYNVATRIDRFITDTSHPSRLRENLHYLREIGDFSAHTMKDYQGQIVNVEREEAEWTVKIVADLFDYFIVAPEKDRLRREVMDKKLQDTGRKPIKKLTPSTP